MQTSMKASLGAFLFSIALAGAAAASDTGTTANGPDVAGLCALVHPCGDVNGSGTVTTSDALSVLRLSVGQTVDVNCDVSGSSGDGGLLRTGQTKCYDQVGAEIACAGTGQDAETKTGVALSYTDNGNGTITDNVTGLVWEKLDDSNADGIAGIHDKDKTWSFPGAVEDKIATFNTFSFGGRSDWRIPNIRELESLKHFGNSPAVHALFNSGCTPGCTTATCSCPTGVTLTWSSTTYDDLESYQWAVGFSDGQTFAQSKLTGFHVRAVAGGS